MGQARPAPNTAPLPVASSIAEHSGVEARRLEREHRTGVIFETSRPGQILLDGQAPKVDQSSKKVEELEKTPEKQPETVPTEQQDSELKDADADESIDADEQAEPDGESQRD